MDEVLGARPGAPELIRSKLVARPECSDVWHFDKGTVEAAVGEESAAHAPTVMAHVLGFLGADKFGMNQPGIQKEIQKEAWWCLLNGRWPDLASKT